MAILSVKGEALPSPVSIQIDDELIWSSESGRDLSGLAEGDLDYLQETSLHKRKRSQLAGVCFQRKR